MFKNFFFIAWPAIGMIDTKKGYNISTIRRDGKKKKERKKRSVYITETEKRKWSSAKLKSSADGHSAMITSYQLLSIL